MAQNSLRTLLHQELFDNVKRNIVTIRKFLARREFIKGIQIPAVQIVLEQALHNRIDTLLGLHLERWSGPPKTSLAMNKLDTSFDCQKLIRLVNSIDRKFQPFRHFTHRRHLFAIVKTGIDYRFFYIFN